MIRFAKAIMVNAHSIACVLLAGYGLARSLIEFVREPDAQLGFILGNFSMGQILSFPMIIFGLYLIMRKPAASQPLDSSR